MEQNKPIKIKGTAYWANLSKKNQLSDAYQVDIGDLSDSAVKALESIGIEAKHKEAQGFYITCKSKYPIDVYDSGKNKLEDVIVGNGSKVEVVVGSYEWKFKNKKGVSPSLKSFVVKELVEYKTPDEVDVDAEEAL